MKTKKTKPYREAQKPFAGIGTMIGRLIVSCLICCGSGILFSTFQALNIVWLKNLISALVILGVWMLYLSEGRFCGKKDCTASRVAERIEERGEAVGIKEDAACYQPIKPILAGLVVFIIPITAAVLVRLLANYNELTADGIYRIDIVRACVRLLVLPFINLISDPITKAQIIDTFTPVVLFTYPLLYLAGYLLGRKDYEKQESKYRKAKKAAKRRAEKSTLVQELLGAKETVHYGHRMEENSVKKKELL